MEWNFSEYVIVSDIFHVYIYLERYPRASSGRGPVLVYCLILMTIAAGCEMAGCQAHSRPDSPFYPKATQQRVGLLNALPCERPSNPPTPSAIRAFIRPT